MTAKEYLKQICRLEIRIKQLDEEIYRLRAEASGVKGIRYDGVKAKTMPESRMEDAVIKYTELDAKAMCERNRLIALREKIIRQINSLNDVAYVAVLYERYVNIKGYRLQGWEEIADKLGYSESWIKMMHGKALQAFAQRYKRSLKLSKRQY